MSDSGADIQVTPSLTPDVRTANTYNGTSVNRQPQGQDGFEDGVLQVCSGDPDAGTFTLNGVLQHSDDDSVWVTATDETGANIAITQITAADTQQTVRFRAKRLRKYLRAQIVTTNAGGGANVECAANVILCSRRKL